MPPGKGPDKRTAAYENIFGRPTAKPKGPAPPPGTGAIGYPPSGGAGAPHGQPHNNPQFWAYQQQLAAQQQQQHAVAAAQAGGGGGVYQQGPGPQRWNSVASLHGNGGPVVPSGAPRYPIPPSQTPQPQQQQGIPAGYPSGYLPERAPSAASVVHPLAAIRQGQATPVGMGGGPPALHTQASYAPSIASSSGGGMGVSEYDRRSSAASSAMGIGATMAALPPASVYSDGSSISHGAVLPSGVAAGATAGGSLGLYSGGGPPPGSGPLHPQHVNGAAAAAAAAQAHAHAAAVYAQQQQQRPASTSFGSSGANHARSEFQALVYGQQQAQAQLAAQRAFSPAPSIQQMQSAQLGQQQQPFGYRTQTASPPIGSGAHPNPHRQSVPRLPSIDLHAASVGASAAGGTGAVGGTDEWFSRSLLTDRDRAGSVASGLTSRDSASVSTDLGNGAAPGYGYGSTLGRNGGTPTTASSVTSLSSAGNGNGYGNVNGAGADDSPKIQAVRPVAPGAPRRLESEWFHNGGVDEAAAATVGGDLDPGTAALLGSLADAEASAEDNQEGTYIPSGGTEIAAAAVAARYRAGAEPVGLMSGWDDGNNYRRELDAAGQPTSSASSVYDGISRRRESFESDRQSIANSVYTLSGSGRSGGAGSAGFYGGVPSGSASGFFNPAGAGLTALTPYNAQAALPGTTGSGSGAGGAWSGSVRHRTTSSATQAAQNAYAPGSSAAHNSAEWRQSIESMRANGARSAAPVPQPSLQQHQAQPPTGDSTLTVRAKGPLVYPALLSRVAKAFKERVTIAERIKDGLAYKDAFDGREAVDRIAYIIKTTDRNLALLLGRALDAQKFFHDVTYDHRLRDSSNELYQFRVRLATPFGSEDDAPFHDAPTFFDAQGQAQSGAQTLTVPPASAASSVTPSISASSSASAVSPQLGPTEASSKAAVGTGMGAGSGTDSDEDELPTGVFTLLTDCYSPTCTRDRLCYSIACPRRLEQQARLNLKPQPGLKRSISKESLGETKEPGALWAESVSKEVLESVSETERKRQELINEVISTERDFVRDLEYLRDRWMKPLRTGEIVPEDRRDDFVTQVFWNVLEIHAVNSKLCDMLLKRQKQQDVVENIGDIFLEMVPQFQPFVKYGAHQLYGKYEFEKEKSSNAAFMKFVDETERLPESRKLELNGYLTKPTTRLARYPLLMEQVAKHTDEKNSDKQTLPEVIKIIKEFLTKVNTETGKSENRFNLAQLDQQLVFKQGEAVDLRLRDEARELVFKGPLKRRGGTQSESAELQVYLFDHALLMVKAKTVQKSELYKVYRKPIPLELLVATIYDDVPTGKGTATRPKSTSSKMTTGNRLGGMIAAGAPKQDPKTGYALTFTYLGRKGYSMTLWANTFVSRQKWFEHIESRQEILRARSNIFDIVTLSSAFFNGPGKVNCSVPFDFGRRIIYGTDDGVYLSELREKSRPPTKVLPLPGVTQMDVLEEYQVLIVLADKTLHTFTLDALDPLDPMGSLKRGRRIQGTVSFFRAGVCLGRTLVCVVKSSSLSSTIKTLEPIDQSMRGKKRPTFQKLLQGPGQESLRVFKEFYIPTESSSVHFLKTKLCVGCNKGFEIVDLETLDTQGLLDPADSNLDFVQRKENVKPIAIYRIHGEFLLCYDEFAFYVNKNGWRSKGNWIIHWEGHPSSFALHHPYVLAFEPSFIEVRHVETGALHQVITGSALRCLFADVPPPPPPAQAAAMNAMQAYGRMPMYPAGLQRAQSLNLLAPYQQRPPPPMQPYAPQPGLYGPPRPPQPQAMPYAFTQAAPPLQRPAAPTSPMWESAHASRSHIVFQGEGGTIYHVKLAEPKPIA